MIVNTLYDAASAGVFHVGVDHQAISTAFGGDRGVAVDFDDCLDVRGESLTNLDPDRFGCFA